MRPSARVAVARERVHFASGNVDVPARATAGEFLEEHFRRRANAFVLLKKKDFGGLACEFDHERESKSNELFAMS